MSDDIKIYGKLTNATTDNVLAGADQIYDSYQKQFQQDINKLIPKLDSGKIPSKYLPSYVDDVVEGRLIDIRTFETEGKPQQTGVIYLDTETNISYRWSGSQYVKISSPLELGTTEDTALKGSLGINTTDVSRTENSVDISLIKYSGNQIGIHIPSATSNMAGVMSTSDKIVVDKANYVITAEPVVGNLSVDSKGNQVSIGYLQVEDGNNSVSESVNLPLATITSAGLLSKEDKIRLDQVTGDIAEAEISGFTKETSPNKVTLKLSNANQTLSLDLNEVTTTNAGVMSATDKTKLDTLDWYFEE